MINTLRKATIIHNLLLNPRQELMLRYHPIWVLGNFKKDKNVSKNEDGRLPTLTEVNDMLNIDKSEDLSKIDNELIKQLLGSNYGRVDSVSYYSEPRL